MEYSKIAFIFLCVNKTIFSSKQKLLQKHLKETRIAAGLTQIELAKKLGLRQSFVSKYESGERRLDLVEISEICSALDIPLSQFVKKFESSMK